jgi:hypothetical protein
MLQVVRSSISLKLASLTTAILSHRKELAVWLIIAGVMVDLLFDVIENGPRANRFCWTGHCFVTPTDTWDGKWYLSTYIYYFGEHGSRILFFMAAFLSPTRRIFLILAGFEFCDMIEYAITANSTWMELDKVRLFSMDAVFKLDFNLFKSAGIILFCMRELYGSSSTDN